MTKYTPKPGSIAAKVIDHLTKHGGALTPKDIFDLFGTPGKNLYPLLATPIRHGLLERTGAGKNGVRFQLGGTDTSAATKKRAKRPDLVPEPEQPCGCLYSDDDVCVFGAQVTDSGAVLLDDALARRLHRFLERIYGPVVTP